MHLPFVLKYSIYMAFAMANQQNIVHGTQLTTTNGKPGLRRVNNSIFMDM